jgi:hypothetical protein
MAWYQDRKVQVGGGAAAVAALALGVWGLGGFGGGSSARVAELCGAAPAQLADATLMGLVTGGASSVTKAAGSENLMNEIENQAKTIFRGTPEAQRTDVEASYRHAVCSAVATAAKDLDEARVKYTAAQESMGKGLLAAIAESEQCVKDETLKASAEEPFSIDGTATAVAAGADGKEVVDLKSICHTAKPGYGFANVAAEKIACSAEERCVVKDVRYAADADGNQQACVDFEAKSEAKAFGAGAAVNVKLSGATAKTMTDVEKVEIATKCHAKIPGTAANPAEPTIVDPASSGTPATETPAPAETPAETPAAPEAAPAAPAEPVVPAPATP